MSEIETLRAAVQQLRDIESLKRLKALYCHLVDSRSWDELDRLWTEDAACNYGFFGSYQGRRGIMDGFFRGAVDQAASFMVHMVHNPVVDVQGDEAQGSWYLTAQTTLKATNQAVWVMGIYRDRFRRVGGEWKIAVLDFEFKYYSPYEDGWAKTPIMKLPG